MCLSLSNVVGTHPIALHLCTCCSLCLFLVLRRGRFIKDVQEGTHKENGWPNTCYGMVRSSAEADFWTLGCVLRKQNGCCYSLRPQAGCSVDCFVLAWLLKGNGSGAGSGQLC